MATQLWSNSQKHHIHGPEFLPFLPVRKVRARVVEQSRPRVACVAKPCVRPKKVVMAGFHRPSCLVRLSRHRPTMPRNPQDLFSLGGRRPIDALRCLPSSAKNW